MKLRLRSLLHENGRESEFGVTLEATGNVRGWLVVAVDVGDLGPVKRIDYLTRIAKIFEEKLGEKVLCVPKGTEFCVFEKVASPEESRWTAPDGWTVPES